MTLDQKIALFATIGTCVSAIATLLTILQMKKQRADSYRPDLVFSSLYFKGQSGDGSKAPGHWVHLEGNDESKTSSRELTIPMHNVGLGAARSVSLTWSFPIEQMVEDVKALVEKAGRHDKITLQNGCLNIESDELGRSLSMWKGQQKRNLDFVLPASAAKEPLTVELPHAYVQLCSVLVYLGMQLKDIKQFPNIFPINAKLEYLDIGGTKHKIAFELKLNLFVIERGATSMRGQIECKRIS